MNQTSIGHGTGGWRCPCAPFDYHAFAESARRECENIRLALEAVKKERPRTAELELVRRRRIRMLTDMYYEQRGNLLGLEEKLRERRECTNT